MDAKKFLEKIRVDRVLWFCLIVLFGLSLLVPPIREAQVLCARLLLHLRGATFVQGQPGGCIIYTVPNVQFTDKTTRLLQDRATNSIEDFALADATQDWEYRKFPPASASTTNEPLLEWFSIRYAWLAGGGYSFIEKTTSVATNMAAKAAIENALDFVRLAEQANPTNGALWVIKARLYFAENRESEALDALAIAASNSVWTVGLEKSFSLRKKSVFEAGLSDLDAAIAVNWGSVDLFFLAMQSQCGHRVHDLLGKSAVENNGVEFEKLIKLITDLSSAKCPEHSDCSFNQFRRIEQDLASTNELSTNHSKFFASSEGAMPKGHAELQTQAVRDFALRAVERGLFSRFCTQREDSETEQTQRRTIINLRNDILEERMAFVSISGLLAVFDLALVLSAIVFELTNSHLGNRPYVSGQKGQARTIWAILSAAILLNTIVFACAWIGLGLGNDVGMQMTISKPFINRNVPPCLTVLALWVMIYGLIYFLVWKKKEKLLTYGRLTMIPFCSYLILICAMALYRWLASRAVAPW